MNWHFCSIYLLAKEPSEPGRILSKEPSEPLYYQRSQVNQNIIKGTERTLAKNYILAKEPTNKLERTKRNEPYLYCKSANYVDHPM